MFFCFLFFLAIATLLHTKIDLQQTADTQAFYVYLNRNPCNVELFTLSAKENGFLLAPFSNALSEKKKGLPSTFILKEM